MNKNIIQLKVDNVKFDFSDYQNKFFAFIDVKESTLSTYRQGLDKFGCWLTSQNINRPVHKDIKEYKNHLINTDVERIRNGIKVKEKMSVYSVNSYLIIVKLFFKFLDGVRLYPDTCIGIKLLKKSKKRSRKSLSEKNIIDLYNEIQNQSGTKQLRDKAIYDLLLSAGLRAMELINLNVGNIEKGGVTITGKGRDEQEFIQVPPDVLQSLGHYLAIRGTLEYNDAVFVSLSNNSINQRLTRESLSRMGKQYLRAIGLNDARYCLHSCRHTAITMWIKSRRAQKKKVDIIKGMKYSRHLQAETFIKYVDDVDDEKDDSQFDTWKYIKQNCLSPVTATAAG